MFPDQIVNLCTAQYIVAIASATAMFRHAKELDIDYDCSRLPFHVSIQCFQH